MGCLESVAFDTRRRVGVLALMVATFSGAAGATTVSTTQSAVPCGTTSCAWSVAYDGKTVDSGSYSIDSSTGNVVTGGTASWTSGGDSFSLGLTGNSDPILGFSFSASTSATSGGTFSVTLSLPISLSGPIAASSSVSYSLTSTTAAGAQITPLFGHTVVAQEVSSTGASTTLNKGVDVGGTFSVSGGPATQNSSTYTAANLFTLAQGNTYDLMSVTIAFSLSAGSSVGVSGFVQQTPVPLPATAWLFLSGVGLLAARTQQKKAKTS